MSETQSTDEQALNAFKACFGLKATPIESAFGKVTRLTGEITVKGKEIDAAIVTRDDKLKLKNTAWKSLQQQIDKGKNPKQSDKQVTTASELEEAETDLSGKRGELDVLKLGKAEAEKEKLTAPVKVASEHATAMRQRLEKAGKTTDSVPQALRDAVRVELAKKDGPVDAVRLNVALKAYNDAVDGLCAPAELDKKRENIAARLLAIAHRPYKNDIEIGLIDGLAKGAPDDIGVLDGAVETRLAAAETQASAFTGRFDAAKPRPAEIKLPGALKPERCAAVEKTILAMAKATTALSQKMVDDLTPLETALEELEEARDTAVSQRDDYVIRQAKVASDILLFTKRSPSHSGYGSSLNPAREELKQAQRFVDDKDYPTALFCLDEAQDIIDACDVRATTQGNEQDKIKAAALSLQKKKLAADAAKQLAIQQQKAAENADAVTALNAIGRNGKLNQWLLKVNQQIDAGRLTMTVGDARDLNNDRQVVEVRLDLSPTTGIVTPSFVVHYHPRLTKQDLQMPNSSAMHCKAYINAPSIKNLPMDQVAWVKDRVPTLRQIKDSF